MEFDCKEKDCTKKVSFIAGSHDVRGSDGGRLSRMTKSIKNKLKEVYLTCEDEHIHKYKVKS